MSLFVPCIVKVTDRLGRPIAPDLMLPDETSPLCPQILSFPGTGQIFLPPLEWLDSHLIPARV